MAETLLPCPFCGELPQMSGKKVMHACRVLDKEIRTSVPAWNRRAERTCHVVATDENPYGCECSECGQPDIDGWNYCPSCGARVVTDDDR